MAITRYVGNTITCLSTDTKPTNIPDGARCFVIDTWEIYLKVSGSWTLISYKKTGTQAISNAVSSVTVTFDSAESDTNYHVSATLVNTTDSPPSLYSLLVTSKTVNGFTVTLSDVTDSANYKLDWAIFR